MLLNNKHYYNLSSEERKDLWKHYKKAYPNMGYSDMVNHFHGEVEKYRLGGKEDKYVAEKDATATKKTPAISTNPNAFKEKVSKYSGPSVKDLDVVTDIMQLGNFIPLPPAQFVGKIGNVAGAAIDAYQAVNDYDKGNYGDMAGNLGSAALGIALSSKGYKRDMWNTTPGSTAEKIAKLGSREGEYRPLTAYKHLKNNPVIKKGINYNKAGLGAVGAETAYDYQFGGRTDYFNSDIKKYKDGGEDNETIIKSEKLPATTDPNTGELIGSKTLPEFTVRADENIEPSERIINQNNIIKNTNPNKNYAIVDKKDNIIFYYNPNGELINREAIVTGKSNNDIDKGLSMKNWFKKTGSNSHEDYFKYLENNKFQTTPSGIYNISGYKTDIATDPSLIGRLINTFRPKRAKEIHDSRIKDYGEQEKMFTLQSEFGIGSSKAIHGTANPVRLNAFKTPGADRNLSNGCVNVNGETICFDTLEKNSGIYILPEESDNLLYPNNIKTTKIRNRSLNITKKLVEDSLKKSNISYTPESLAFIAAVAEKETHGGKSLNAKLQDYIPSRFVKSKGTFQINPRTFSKYLPENYTGNFDDQVKAVDNFYKNNINENDVVSLYKKYAGDPSGKYSTRFNSLYNTALNLYKNGGLIKNYKEGGLTDAEEPIVTDNNTTNKTQSKKKVVLTKEEQDKINNERRNALITAKNKLLATETPENKPKMNMLYSTTMAAENEYGRNPAAYKRGYTNSQMSVDAPALKELFTPKGEKGRYVLQQKKNFQMMEDLGLPTTKKDLKTKLRDDDAYTALATTKVLYGNEKALNNLPNPIDTMGYINLYINKYNKKGGLKHLTREQLQNSILEKMRDETRYINNAKKKAAEAKKLTKKPTK